MRARTATSDRLAAGFRVGDYAIEDELDVDDVVTLYAATHLVLPRKATVKVLHEAAAAQRTAAVQLLREACLLEALGHPAVPRVYECGVLGDERGDASRGGAHARGIARRPWAAFERVEGTALATRLDAGTLPLVDLVVILRDVAVVLAHAHARGVVHCQLTARAITCTPRRGHPVCVGDWECARTLDTQGSGTLDPRDDLHALGMIATLGLTGKLPDPAVPTIERCPAAPAALATLIDEILAPDPAARPSSEHVAGRLRWLATTLEPLADQPKWSPARGPDPRYVPAVEDDGFAVRISRTRSSIP